MTSQAEPQAERTGPQSLAYRYLPVLAWLPAYNRALLVPDAVAALTVWALLVPEAMAYATIAGVPLEAGLYAAILPLFLYAIFGTSRQLFTGPSSTVAILSAATIAPLADGTEEFIALTAALAILVGVILVVAGVARMGWVSQFMAKPVLQGFVIGLALVVLVGQVDKLFGVDAEGDNFWQEALQQVRWWGARALARRLRLHRRRRPRSVRRREAMHRALALLHRDRRPRDARRPAPSRRRRPGAERRRAGREQQRATSALPRVLARRHAAPRSDFRSVRPLRRRAEAKAPQERHPAHPGIAHERGTPRLRDGHFPVERRRAT